MSEKGFLIYVFTTLEAIEKIKIYSKEIHTPEVLLSLNDQMNFNAINRLLLTIGEEVKKIEVDLLNTQPQFQWHEIIGLRNRMAHDYRGIDPEIIFDIVKQELTPLKNALISMLMLNPIDKDLVSKALDSPFYKNLEYLRQTLGFGSKEKD
jgi:uncharacterized protein with HEPN domain